MFKVARKLSFLALIILLIAACNLPSNATPTEDPNAVFTAAALADRAGPVDSSSAVQHADFATSCRNKYLCIFFHIASLHTSPGGLSDRSL